MKHALSIANLFLYPFLGLALFTPTLNVSAAEIPPAEQEAISEDCVAKAEKELEKRGILPSEESSEYDNTFDVIYSECIQSAGLTDAPIEESDEDLPQRSILQ